MKNPEVAKVIERAAMEAYIRALKLLPPDVEKLLIEAAEKESTSIGKQIFKTMLENVKLAKQEQILICQDTGIPMCFLRFGEKFPLSLTQVMNLIKSGCKRATLEHPLRPNVVHPLTRKNTGTNTGTRVPIFDLEFIPDADYLEFILVPKGSGSEAMSFLKMLPPAEGIEGIKRFICSSICTAGANPCPPVVVGVGIGGTSDECLRLSKRAALIRTVGVHHPDPEIAALESELLNSINKLGIGPQGLGGDVTALWLAMEVADTHITLNPVAVSLQCWPARRSGARIYADGNIQLVWSYDRV